MMGMGARLPDAWSDDARRHPIGPSRWALGAFGVKLVRMPGPGLDPVDAVAACSLGGEEGRVRGAEEPATVCFVDEAGDAGRDRDRHDPSIDRFRARGGNRFADPLCGVDGSVAIGAGCHDDELLAAVANDDIALADGALDRAGD